MQIFNKDFGGPGLVWRCEDKVHASPKLPMARSGNTFNEVEPGARSHDQRQDPTLMHEDITVCRASARKGLCEDATISQALGVGVFESDSGGYMTNTMEQ
jgi:hypothetical protein